MRELSAEEIKHVVGKQAAKARKLKNITQKEAAGHVGRKHPQISNFERGKADMPFSSVIRLTYSYGKQLNMYDHALREYVEEKGMYDSITRRYQNMRLYDK